jgi:hypothetical protein
MKSTDSSPSFKSHLLAESREQRKALGAGADLCDRDSHKALLLSRSSILSSGVVWRFDSGEGLKPRW